MVQVFYRWFYKNDYINGALVCLISSDIQRKQSQTNETKVTIETKCAVQFSVCRLKCVIIIL